MHGAGCVRPWFPTAEPLGERRYKNLITHTVPRKANSFIFCLTLLHLERSILYTILAFLGAIGLSVDLIEKEAKMKMAELLALKAYSFALTNKNCSR